MKRYLCAEAALDRLDIPGFRGFIIPRQAVVTPDYVVFTDQSLYRPKKTSIHTCKISGAAAYTEGDCCRPALAFLQASIKYDFRKTVLLAQLLCSWRGNKPPLCSKQELLDCAHSLEGFYGRRDAIRALRYVLDGCRSPMEAITYLLLCLPMCHGGCGFRSFVFDHEIYCPKSDKLYYADLCDIQKKVILEYDSDEHHSTKEQKQRDYERRENLRSEGYKVISIHYQQLKNKHKFESLIFEIAKAIGKKMIVRARKFFENFAILRELLKNFGHKEQSSQQELPFQFFPRFRNARKMYNLYLKAFRRREFFPLIRTALTS